MGNRHFEFEGILPAMVTPMLESGDVDEDGLRRLTERLIGAGIGGLVPCGSTGEFQSLSTTERRRVAEVVIDAAAGKVPVAPHTGALSTAETIELSQHAASAGAAAVMVIPPFYEPLSWGAVVEHFRAVAASIDIPIIFYNLPGATGIRPTPAQICELADVGGVDWIKDSSGDAVFLTELVQRYGDRIGVMNGWDSLTLYGLLSGTRASIWGTANVIPELCVALYDAAVRRRDLDEACAIWRGIWPICNFLETSTSYVAAVKAGCAVIGEPVGDPRRPLLPLDGTAKADLAGLIEATRKVAAGAGVS